MNSARIVARWPQLGGKINMEYEKCLISNGLQVLPGRHGTIIGTQT